MAVLISGTESVSKYQEINEIRKILKWSIVVACGKDIMSADKM